MILKKTNAKFKDPFEEVGNPDFTYTEGKMKLNLYFIDSYDWKEELLKKQLFYINNKESEFSLLIEKEIYDLIPEYYSKESLHIMATYFNSLNSRNVNVIAVGGIVLTLLSVIGINYFVHNLLISTVSALTIGIIYMVFVLFRTLQSNIYKSRVSLRQSLIRLFTEEKLDGMLDQLDAYMARRQEELS